MNKNPILVVTGLAVAAVAGIAGLTKDKWMTAVPQQVAATVTEGAAPAVETPAQQPSATQAPAVEQPAAETPAAQPAAEQPATAVAPAAQPATTEAAVQPPAAEQPAAPVVAETPAVQPAAELPAATQAPAPQPAAEQQTAAVQPEQPAPPVETAAPAADVASAAKETIPAFDTVRVEKTGEAVIAGTAKAGSEVVVKFDGQAIGTTTANSDGSFVVVPDAPLPTGSGALTIESTSKGDLQPTQSEQSVAVIIPAGAKQDALVAVVSPDAPTKVLQKPQPETTVVAAAPAAEQPAVKTVAPKFVSIDAVDYDSTGNIVFSGQGTAGQIARIYVDNAHTGDAVIGGDGRWSFAGTAAVAAGQHALRVDGVDGAGKVVNRVEVPFIREETSKVAASTQAEAVVVDAQKTDSEAAGEAQSNTAATTVNPQITDAAPLPPKQGRVVIQPGNNLWRISRVLYGTGEKYTMLYQANKDQIRDPDMIFPGQIFTTPEVAPKTETIDPKRREPLKPEENAASGQ